MGANNIGPAAGRVLERYAVVGFKQCPRCRGDVQTVHEWYGEYINCLQCGHVAEVQRVREQVDWSKIKDARPKRSPKGSRRDAE